MTTSTEETPQDPAAKVKPAPFYPQGTVPTDTQTVCVGSVLTAEHAVALDATLTNAGNR